jgi:hypothetical protein
MESKFFQPQVKSKKSESFAIYPNDIENVLVKYYSKKVSCAGTCRVITELESLHRQLMPKILLNRDQLYKLATILRELEISWGHTKAKAVSNVLLNKMNKLLRTFQLDKREFFDLIVLNPELSINNVAVNRLVEKNKLLYEAETYKSGIGSIDISLNQSYKATLLSRKNINFILQHEVHAELIADVLILLHQAMIGKEAQEQAEAYICTDGDDHVKGLLLVKKAFKLLQEKMLFNGTCADLVIQLCEPENRSCVIEITIAAIERNNLANGRLYLSNPDEAMNAPPPYSPKL